MLVDIGFFNSPEYSKNTFAVETLVVPLTKVFGYTATLLIWVRIFLEPKTENQATKKIIKDLYEPPKEHKNKKNKKNKR